MLLKVFYRVVKPVHVVICLAHVEVSVDYFSCRAFFEVGQTFLHFPGLVTACPVPEIVIGVRRRLFHQSLEYRFGFLEFALCEPFLSLAQSLCSRTGRKHQQCYCCKFYFYVHNVFSVFFLLLLLYSTNIRIISESRYLSYII